MGLFSLIVHGCGLQPATVSLELSPSIPWKKYLSETEKLDDILEYFLRRTVALELKYTSYTSLCKDVISVLQSVLKAVSRNIGESPLKSLYCPSAKLLKYLSPYFFTFPRNLTSSCYHSLSALELGTVNQDSLQYFMALLKHQSTLEYISLTLGNVYTVEASAVKLFSSLSSLFSRPQFKVLWLGLDHDPTQHTSLLLELLWRFMTAPCSHAIELHVLAYCNIVITKPIPSLDTTVIVPECGLQHKRPSFTGYAIGLLLQMPTVRLKNIQIDCIEYHDLHLGAPPPSPPYG